MLSIVDHIDGDSERFKELMDCFLGDSYRVTQRAAWAVSICIERHPSLVTPYFGKFLEQLERPDSHVAIRRNVARLLQFVEIPRRLRGRVFNICYDLFAEPAETVAVRVSAMTVAAQIAKHEPDLLEELRIVAKEYLPKASPAFRSRSKRVLGL